jgi:hypothetical protein
MELRAGYAEDPFGYDGRAGTMGRVIAGEGSCARVVIELCGIFGPAV